MPALEAQTWELPAVDVLDRLLAEGVAWLASTDAVALSVLRDALEYQAELRSDPKVKPSDVLAAQRAVVSLLADLGFTPAARTRLGLAEVKTASKLEELESRRR